MEERMDLYKEKEIAQYLHEHWRELFIGSGSSRAVFSIDEGLAKILGTLPFDCIIKMSLGLGGYRQSVLEYNTYCNYEELQPCLATIVARGSIFTVMESVDTNYDFYEFYDCYDCDAEEMVNEWYDEDEDGNYPDGYERDIKFYNQARDVIYQLEEYFGNTSDNCQLGLTDSGDLVAYDYGFDGSRYACEQMTGTSHYFSYGRDRSQTDLFFEILLDALEEEMTLGFDFLDEDDFDRIEKSYCHSIEDEEDEDAE
jgi:hypothetical protein